MFQKYFFFEKSYIRGTGNHFPYFQGICNMAKYRNYCAFLDEFFDVLTSADEFKESKEIRFQCKVAGHVNVLKATTFGNKKSAIPNPAEWCEVCKKAQTEEKDTLGFADEVKELGHTILAVTSGKFVRYRCGNCDRECTTTKQNFRRDSRTRFCVACQNEPRRLTYEDVCKVAEEHGMKLLTLAHEYRTNKQKLRLLCVCGNDQYEAVLSDIRRGKHCKENCKTRKFEATCMERYAVRNVSQHPQIEAEMAKKRRTAKLYTFSSERTVFVEGYENLVLDFLRSSIADEDIVVGAQEGVPSIPYIMDGKENRYTPDIYIKSTNTLVEVKYLYYFDTQREKNILKFNAALAHGYCLRLMMYDKRVHLREFYFSPNMQVNDDFLEDVRDGIFWRTDI